MKQGEIWLVNLDPTIGAEIRKTRPVIIINDNSLGILPLKIIVPITDWKAHYQKALWMIKLEPDSNNNLTKVSAVDCFQIRSVSNKRFVKKVGTVNKTIVEKIEVAVGKLLIVKME